MHTISRAYGDTARPPHVIGYGDSVFDVFPSRGLQYPGGNCLNFAVFCRFLGAHSEYVGVVGDDERGRRILDVLETVDVRTDHVQIRDGQTGWTGVNVVDGDRVFFRGNDQGVTRSKPTTLTPDLLIHMRSAQLVHSSAYSLSSQDVPQLADGPIVTFDFSEEDDRRTDEYLAALAPFIELGLFSCSHISLDATIHLLERANRAGMPLTLATRGKEGSVAFDGNRMFHQTAIAIDNPSLMRDTTGCGDAFLAAFVMSLLEHGWTRGASMSESRIEGALREAAVFARDQCFVEGAFGYGGAISDPAPANGSAQRA
ncbi:MAG TPA: PfkB family carbohydrate kinase [Acidothermaceae bacterium]|nr:PfkB family carbohydrate kinase [Acidothermaceae bacterium]